MFEVRQNCLIAFGILFLSFQFVKSQNVPPIPCPEIFKYVQSGDNYMGRVTLITPLQTTVVDVEFSQRERITTNFNGRLSLNQDLKTTQSNLESGIPISYRVDFPNSHILPKLVGISVNGARICQGEKYNAPSTTFKLQHSFFPAPGRTGVNPQPIAQPTSTSNLEDNVIRLTYILDPTTNTITSKTSPPQQQTSIKKISFDNPFLHEFLGNHPKSVYEIPLSIPNSNREIATAPPRISVTPVAVIQRTAATPQPSQNVGCGREGLQPFIAGGHDFQRGKFPWLAAVYIRDSVNLNFACGGSLISSRTVITAAHCFPSTTFSPYLVSVSLGRHNLFISEDGSEQRDLSNLIIHPEYNTSLIADADIALLVMNSPVSFNLYIRPICLWSQSTELSLIENKKGYIAGWGADNNGNPVTSQAKMAEENIVSESECLRSSELHRRLTSSRSICAGNRDGSGPCIGDSGCGLMLDVYGVWTLRGIVSIGPIIRGANSSQRKCNLEEYVVYCDVAKHMSWIRRNMIS